MYHILSWIKADSVYYVNSIDLKEIIIKNSTMIMQRLQLFHDNNHHVIMYCSNTAAFAQGPTCLPEIPLKLYCNSIFKKSMNDVIDLKN